MQAVSAPPPGPVTICFADVEDSTPIQTRYPELWVSLLASYRRVVREAFATQDGYEVDTEGDGFFYVFPDSRRAVAAAHAAQLGLAAADWPPGGAIRVRMGIHAGHPVWTSEGYVGLDVVRAHRVMASGYGGQVLVSGETIDQLRDLDAAGFAFVDLGLHQLKGLAAPIQIHQLMVEGASAHFPPLKSVQDRAGNLPIQPNGLIGREQELADLKDYLSRREVRAITLTGPGGTGKTRLALEAASQVSLQFANGVCFVPLAAVRELAGFAPAVARAAEIGDSDASIESLVAHFAPRDTLLVLDNFEQILSAASAVATLLASAPRLKVLVTSREGLHIRGEREMALGPLAVPEPDQPFDDIASCASVRLFVERATAVRPGFTLTSESAASVARLCRRLDGLPLAIELVAARSRLLSPDALLERSSGLFDLAANGARDLPERHQSLRSAIAWSYDLLPPDQQSVFRHIAVFAGSFTLDAVAAVVPEENRGAELFDMLDALVSKSLVRVAADAADPVRFTMFEALREYGLMKLREHGQYDAAATNHLNWFRSLVVHASANETQTVVVQLIDADIDNVRAALSFALSSPETATTGLSLISSGHAFWWQRSIAEGVEWMERLLEIVPRRPSRMRSFALSRLAFLAESFQTPERIIAIAQECVDALPEADEISVQRVMALNSLGDALANGGQLERAVKTCAEAVDLARKSGQLRLVGITLWPYGRTLLASGDVEGAWAAWTESCERFEEAGEDLLLATPLSSLAQLAIRRGMNVEAEALIGKGVLLIRRTNDVPRTSDMLALHAGSRLALGDIPGAEASLRESLDVLRSATGGIRVTPPIVAAADYCYATGRWEEAITLVTAARSLARGPEGHWIDQRQADLVIETCGSHLGSEALVRAGSSGARLSRAQAIEVAMQAVTHA